MSSSRVIRLGHTQLQMDKFSLREIGFIFTDDKNCSS